MVLYRNLFKFVFDFIISTLLFLLLLPVFFLITLILFIKNQGKPYFFQPRPGKNGKIFKIIKFKTMNDFKEKTGDMLPDKYRLTPVGKFIRKTSLDEIPQLLNVIKGDMSLVGPRPLLTEYLTLYNDLQRRRHEVKPGITGWAQINGRNAISWEQKFEYDVWYVDNLSFWLDLKILWLTFRKVLKTEGISAAGHMTTEKFKGSVK